MRRIVYTANFGGYDTVRPINFTSECEFLYFTDDSSMKVSGWKMVYVSPDLDSSDMNRKLKMMPHKYIDGDFHSLYLDSNIVLKSDPTILFSKYADPGKVYAPKHRYRSCIYEEAAECVRVGKISAEIVDQHVKRYLYYGYPKENGLTENGILFRVHDTHMNHLMEAWWREYCAGAKRDQLCLGYVCWRESATIVYIHESAFNRNRYFRYRIHDKQMRSGLLGAVQDFFLERKHSNIIFEFLSLIKNTINKK